MESYKSEESDAPVFDMKAHPDTDLKPVTTLQKPDDGDGLLSPLVDKIRGWLQEGNLVTFLGTGQGRGESYRPLAGTV